ncbi:MAG TPA: hypothetical protein VF442_10425 [Sphingobium sp.]
MQVESQTDHIAMLTLMMVGVLIKRLDDVGQLDDGTKHHLRKLVAAVRIHAENAGHDDLHILFDNIDRALGNKTTAAAI